jgi:hypothetical protein
MIRDIVNEGTTSYLSVTFKDKDGAAQAPASARYRIDCLTTGTAILAWTALVVGSTIEITITPVQNAIQTATNPIERKLVTVEGTYTSTDKVVDEYEYQVKNMNKG